MRAPSRPARLLAAAAAGTLLLGVTLSGTASAADSAVYLTWTPPATNGGSAVTGYKVMGKVDGGAFATVVADTGSTVASLHVTQFADTTPIVNGHSYVFSVAAINGVGVGPAAAPPSRAMNSRRLIRPPEGKVAPTSEA